MKTDQKPFAYANGRTGDLVHSHCWFAYVDENRKYDAQWKPFPFGMICTLLFPDKKTIRELKGQVCAHCNKPFEI